MSVPSNIIIDNKDKIKEKLGTEDGTFHIVTETANTPLYVVTDNGDYFLEQSNPTSDFNFGVYTASRYNTTGGRRCLVRDEKGYHLLLKDTTIYCSGWKPNTSDSGLNDGKYFNPKNINYLSSGRLLFSSNEILYNAVNEGCVSNVFSMLKMWTQTNKQTFNGIYGQNRVFYWGQPNIEPTTFVPPTNGESITSQQINNSFLGWNSFHTQPNMGYGIRSYTDKYSVLIDSEKWGNDNNFYSELTNAQTFSDIYKYYWCSKTLPNIKKPNSTEYYTTVGTKPLGNEVSNGYYGGYINIVGYNILVCDNEEDGIDYLNNGTIHDTDYYFDLENGEKINAIEEPESTDDEENGEDGKPTGTEPETPYNENTENVLGNMSSRYYVCDKEKVNQIVNSLWNGLNWEQSFFNDFTGLFDNLNELVISLHWLPIVQSSKEFGTLGEITTRIGAFDLLINKEDETSTFKTNYLLNYPSKDGEKWCKPIEVARFTIKEKFNSYLDFAPWTQLKLFLPFVGFVNIDTNIFMQENKSNILLVECKCDLITGDLTYFIKKNNTIVQIETANCKVDIPISIKQSRSFEQTIADAYTNAVLGNATNTMDALKTSGATKTTKVSKEFKSSVGGSLLNVGADFVNGLNFQQPQPTIKGCASATGKLFLMNYVALYITRPIYNRPKDYSKKFGFPSNHQCKLSDAIGYNEVNAPQIRKWSKPMTNEEIEEIYSILSDGFIVRSE